MAIPYGADAITNEMENERIAVKIILECNKASICYQFEQCQMIFDVKMKDFICKA